MPPAFPADGIPSTIMFNQPFGNQLLRCLSAAVCFFDEELSSHKSLLETHKSECTSPDRSGKSLHTPFAIAKIPMPAKGIALTTVSGPPDPEDASARIGNHDAVSGALLQRLPEGLAVDFARRLFISSCIPPQTFRLAEVNARAGNPQVRQIKTFSAIPCLQRSQIHCFSSPAARTILPFSVPLTSSAVSISLSARTVTFTSPCVLQAMSI